MDDLISRQEVLSLPRNVTRAMNGRILEESVNVVDIENLPSAKPTLLGYSIDHLEAIAIILQKEGLPPERVLEALTDISRIIGIVRDEIEEALYSAFKSINQKGKVNG